MAAGSIGIIRNACASWMRRSVATLAGLAMASSVLACSPPRLFDLRLERLDDPLPATWAGTQGTLTLRVTRVGGLLSPVFFSVTHPMHPFPEGTPLPIEFHDLPDSACFLNSWVGPFFGGYGLYYTVSGELQAGLNASATCRLGYRVAPEVVEPFHVTLTASPMFCASDPNFADNSVVLPLGGMPPAVPVPLRLAVGTWVLMLFGIVALAAMHRRSDSSPRRLGAPHRLGRQG